MSKKLLSVTVKGKEHTWSFSFYEDPKLLDEWRADGLEVEEILNVVPVWAIDAGLLLPWCFFQDLLNFKNPFNR